MDRIDSIVRTIERNSKLMKEYNLRIQELKDELDSIDSQIKWAPHVEMDEKMENEARDMRLGEYNPIGLVLLVKPELANDAVKNSRVKELEGKRVPIQKELDYLLLEKERLRQQNIQLRLEAQEIKKTV